MLIFLHDFLPPLSELQKRASLSLQKIAFMVYTKVPRRRGRCPECALLSWGVVQWQDGRLWIEPFLQDKHIVTLPSISF